MVRRVARAWNNFFFTPQRATSIALFRILYGLIVIVDLLLLFPDWLTCFGPHGLLGLETMHRMEPGPRLNLFTLLPQSDAWVLAFFWVFLLCAVLLTIGFETRLASVATFLCLASIQQRNLYIINSGDQLLRVIGFFLMFAPAGAALSVDRLIRIWRGVEGPEPQPRMPWARRMIQFQLALVYFATFVLKMEGPDWRDGTALYYVLHLDQFRRFPLPSFVLHPLAVRLETWMTLAIEFSMGVLVWFPKIRYAVLAFGVLLHLTIEYSMNIALFEWIMLATYVTFIDARDLQRAWKWVRAAMAPLLPDPVALVYDGSVPKLVRTANLLRALDIFGRLQMTDLQNAGAVSGVPAKYARAHLVALTPNGPLRDRGAVRYAARVLPLLWPVAIRRVRRGRLEASAHVP